MARKYLATATGPSPSPANSAVTWIRWINHFSKC